jgi:hypothetical protein
VCGRRRRLVAGGRRRRELAAGQLLVLSSVAPTQEPPLGWVWARAVYVRTRRAPGRERRARSNLLGASRRVDRGHLLTLLLAACDCEQRRNAPNRCFALLKPDGEAASWSVPRWSLATVPASGSRAAESGFCPSGICMGSDPWMSFHVWNTGPRFGAQRMWRSLLTTELQLHFIHGQR